MLARDQSILHYLNAFRVLSRDQIATLVCNDVKNPAYIASRVCKRLGRDGHLTILAQEKGKQNLYMPKPPLIHPRSIRVNHFLAIADLYIKLDKPQVFDVEPAYFQHGYRPDVYAIIDGIPVCIEVQLSRISKKKMQDKANRFIQSYYHSEHKAKTLWIYSSIHYDVKLFGTFRIKNGLEW
ncbi:hypothetical protein LSG31_00150 [Fodinisporobacter ferrooxydans]|uniref:Competence protein CoiA nuclease-like domain-containing protein n=1 Tax=Fodinisporobacter ferrooxydans TaxID=2901836 RepID=A0ABY4CK73_9BACL|nr:hypothetical protein LSG31_00150 [Alicyclobacillaceae bacterium MYW30-H2]